MKGKERAKGEGEKQMPKKSAVCGTNKKPPAWTQAGGSLAASAFFVPAYLAAETNISPVTLSPLPT